ncbi:helix-turn-helix transcriptional regulator [Thalassotalea fusca]
MDMQLNSNELKRLRETRAWTQSQLAEIADLSLRTVQRIEKTGLASPESMQAICAAFGISVEQLLVSETDDIVESNSHEQAFPSSENSIYNKRLNVFLVPAIVFLGMVVGFTFDEKNVSWLWQDSPIVAVILGCFSLAFWGLYFVNRRRNKLTQ